MSLSGNEKAYLSARSGIERSGASRTGYYPPWVYYIIVDGVVQTATIESLRIGLHQNDQISEASFTVKPLRQDL